MKEMNPPGLEPALPMVWLSAKKAMMATEIGRNGFFHLRTAKTLGRIMKLLRLALLASVEFDHFLCGCCFLNNIGSFAHGLHALLAGSAHALAERPDEKSDQRADTKCNQCQLPIQVQQINDQGESRHQFANNRNQGIGGGFGDMADVIDQPGNNLSRRLMIHVGRW